VLIFPFEGRPKKAGVRLPPVQAFVAPPGLVERLKGLAGQKDRNKMAFAEFQASLKVARIGWGSGAAAIWRKFSDKIDALEESDPWRHEISARAPEQALRLATVVAVGCGSKVIEREDIEWAIEIAGMSAEAASEG
jgi:hypothetical protein